MQLVGAEDKFVTTPFVISGLVQALLGSIVGLIVLRLVFLGVSSYISNSPLLGLVVPQISYLDPAISIAIILMSSGIGAVSSYFSTTKFLDV